MWSWDVWKRVSISQYCHLEDKSTVCRLTTKWKRQMFTLRRQYTLYENSAQQNGRMTGLPLNKYCQNQFSIATLSSACWSSYSLFLVQLQLCHLCAVFPIVSCQWSAWKECFRHRLLSRSSSQLHRILRCSPWGKMGPKVTWHRNAMISWSFLISWSFFFFLLQSCCVKCYGLRYKQFRKSMAIEFDSNRVWLYKSKA